MKTHPLVRALLFFLLPVWLMACSTSPPTDYFILMATASPVAPAPHIDRHIIALDPVEIPQYLRRSHIVSRSHGNHLKISRFAVWGDTLRDNLSRVLLENLSTLLGTHRIFPPFALGRARPTLRIVTLFSQFEPDSDGTVTLKARWHVVHAPTGKHLALRHTHLVSSPVNPPNNYSGVITQMDLLLTQLSQEIAQEVARQVHILAQQEADARSAEEATQPG